MNENIIISGAVEGLVDEAALRTLIRYVGVSVGTIYGKSGKNDLKKRLIPYNNAAKYQPWIVLIDLDHDDDCAANYRATCLKHPNPGMCLRVVVREVEAWLLADKENIAEFLSVPVIRIPDNPEALDDPKQVMVNLARQSRRRNIRADMVPAEGASRTEGNAYTARLIEFIETSPSRWRPDVAASNADSLQRCIRCLHHLIQLSQSSS